MSKKKESSVVTMVSEKPKKKRRSPKISRLFKQIQIQISENPVVLEKMAAIEEINKELDLCAEKLNSNVEEHNWIKSKPCKDVNGILDGLPIESLHDLYEAEQDLEFSKTTYKDIEKINMLRREYKEIDDKALDLESKSRILHIEYLEAKIKALLSKIDNNEI